MLSRSKQQQQQSRAQNRTKLLNCGRARANQHNNLIRYPLYLLRIEKNDRFVGDLIALPNDDDAEDENNMSACLSSKLVIGIGMISEI